MKNSEFCVIMVTSPQMDEAEKIVQDLLSKRFIACGNILPGIQSHYRWKGKLCRDNEVLIIMKSRSTHLETVIERVKSLHSYDVPEIISLPVSGGSQDYLNWLSDSV